MSGDTGQFVLQIVAIFVGGGTVQLILFLLRRRSELRGLDTASDATALNSANAYIMTLQAGDKVLRAEVDALKAEIRSMQVSWDNDRRASTEALNNSEQQMGRCLAEQARLRNDLTVARGQIADLSTKILGRYPPEI